MTEEIRNYGSFEMRVLGDLKLHAYATGNPLLEECFAIEKGDNLVIIEPVSFYDNIAEFASYVGSLKKDVAGLIVSYRATGASGFKNVRKYSTQKATEYAKNGRAKTFVDEFSKAFGKYFDATICEATDIVADGKIEIGGVDFIIKSNDEAFDIEIPEINSIYMHMLGANCHSIVAGENRADSFINELENCVAKKYDFILSSRCSLEGWEAAKTKIMYLKRIKTLAVESSSAEDFKIKVKREFPYRRGDEYLDMTAGFFFPSSSS
jgi:hypothetical protein